MKLQQHRCGDCGRTWSEEQIIDLTRVEDLALRILPGDEVPSGECPGCGGLVYLVKPQEWPKQIKRFLATGLFCGDGIPGDTKAMLGDIGRMLDKAYSQDAIGTIIFEAEDGKFYTVTVEAVIFEAHPSFISDWLEENDEEEDVLAESRQTELPEEEA